MRAAGAKVHSECLTKQYSRSSVSSKKDFNDASICFESKIREDSGESVEIDEKLTKFDYKSDRAVYTTDYCLSCLQLEQFFGRDRAVERASKS